MHTRRVRCLCTGRERVGDVLDKVAHCGRVSHGCRCLQAADRARDGGNELIPVGSELEGRRL